MPSSDGRYAWRRQVLYDQQNAGTAPRHLIFRQSPHIGDKLGLNDSRGVPDWGEWLRLSQSNSGSNAACAETPSPAQYGLLVRILGSSSIPSIIEALVYSARSWNRARLPRMLRVSITSYSINPIVYRALPTEPWGVSFNQSICADMTSRYNNSRAISTPDFECLGPFDDFVVNEPWGYDAGFNVMTNSSEAPFQVQILEAKTAVVLPRLEYTSLQVT
ncbi:hypothetical protein FS837_011472 [Tulasnella sp. UAMH 9824]|nr:hypothetical protein FS837_011472 [Tulasnella sp. UAMH 9824]